MRFPQYSRRLLSGSRFIKVVSLLILGILPAACTPGEVPVAVLTVEPTTVELGFSEARPLKLSWEIRKALEDLDGGLRVFVHVLGDDGDVIRTFDHDFPVPWRPGGLIDYTIDLHQSVLGPPLTPGIYQISIGLYDGMGKRWPLSTAGDPVEEYGYQMATLKAVDRAGTPMFRFSEQWKAIEPGVDQQVLGRRWLASAGSIVVAETAGDGAVWMSLRVPTSGSGERLQILDADLQDTRVLIRSSCGGGKIEVTGVGVHDLEVPVIFPLQENGDGGESECEILIEPNFHLLTVGTTEQRSVLLEMLGWRSDS
jgi:hypothetical protein